eukprot:TRINITY_DN6532_c0_g1_i1.p1 TRINITY_DN6532_c0_g1~~TRINITY_DN6532_c0_g1_i1.p1  ORF type:complete len:115 (+),score=29.89 TRINITY_DN6532_c0_g1_i1:30-374(+)
MPITNKVYLFTKDFIGGEEELGAKLIVGFLKNLSLSSNVPKVVFLAGSAAKLAWSDNESIIEAFSKLEGNGCGVFVCNTCIDFYEAEPKVGAVGNGKQIVELTADPEIQLVTIN